MNPFEIKTSLKKTRQEKPLDWEESALDAQSQVEELHDAARQTGSFTWVKYVIALAFAVLTARVFYLQGVQGSNFRELSDSNRIRSQSLLAPRGLIFDRNGKVLAQNAASFNLVAIPFDLPKDSGEMLKAINSMAEIFEFDPAALIEKLKSTASNSIQPIMAKQNMSSEQAILFATREHESVGFSVQQIPVRDYVSPQTFSHLLGYTGLVNNDELKIIDTDKYDAVDFIGKSGIELAYENYIHGQNGKSMVEVDATGRLLDVLGEQSPVSGNALVLNIDKELQEKLYNLLKSGRSPKAAAVAMNPNNGEILALVSLPGFDTNLFARGIKSQDYSALISDKNLPLFNRSISGVYPPGSTVKPMVAVAALEEGLVTDQTIITDRGVLVIPNQYDPSISYNFYGWDRNGLGPMNIYSAVAKSSDIYFYTVSGGYPGTAVPEGLGAEKLAEYYRKFNLGRPTGIDIPGEKPGLVADPDWKAEYFKDDPILNRWYLGDTYHIGIGQGDMLATPLQVAQWTAIIANNGTGFVPRILNKVLDQNDKVIFESQPKISVEKFARDENIKIAQQAMRQTVLGGSGTQLKSLPISSAGKTGTSQFDGSDPKRTHAWFTAYAPFENPEIVITVLVEAGGEGHAVAVPVARDALKWWAENRYNR